MQKHGKSTAEIQARREALDVASKEGPAKRDKTGQLRELSIEQLNAIDLLVTGQPDRVVAEKVGVTRQTVTEWRLHNLAFRAELNRVRKAIWGESEDFLRALMPKALRQIEKILDADGHEDVAKASFEVLKACGLHSSAGHEFSRVGSDDPRELAREIADSRRLEANSRKLRVQLGAATEAEVDEVMKETERKASAGGAQK